MMFLNKVSMITIEKLKIYEYYDGSIGKFEHAKNIHLKKMSGHEFGIINNIVQDIKLMHKGMTSKSFEEQIIQRIDALCENDDIKAYLLKLSM